MNMLPLTPERVWRRIQELKPLWRQWQMSVPKVAAVIGAGGHRDRPDHARRHPLGSGTLLGSAPFGGTPYLRHPVVVCARRALNEAFAGAAS
jgi:hypothetical protein